MVDHLILERKLKKNAKPIFLRVSGKKILQISRGAIIFGGHKKKKLRSTPINNQPSFTEYLPWENWAKVDIGLICCPYDSPEIQRTHWEKKTLDLDLDFYT